MFLNNLKECLEILLWINLAKIFMEIVVVTKIFQDIPTGENNWF